MSKRLQVLIGEADWRELQRTARAHRVTVAEWVRRALRGAGRRQSSGDVDRKIAALAAASKYEFPSGDIDQMNADIARGYVEESGG